MEMLTNLYIKNKHADKNLGGAEARPYKIANKSLVGSMKMGSP